MGAYENPRVRFFPRNVFPHLLPVAESINCFLRSSLQSVHLRRARKCEKTSIFFRVRVFAQTGRARVEARPHPTPIRFNSFLTPHWDLDESPLSVKELFSARFLEFFSSWVSLTRFGVYNIYRVWCVLPMPKPGLRRGAGAGPAQLVRGARQIDNFLKEKIIVGGRGGELWWKCTWSSSQG